MSQLRRTLIAGTLVGAAWFVLLMIVQLGLDMVVPWWLALILGVGLGVFAGTISGRVRAMTPPRLTMFKVT